METFTLKITKQERDALVRAAEAMADEYRHASEQVSSRYLSAGFHSDAVSFDRLANILKGLASREDINAAVKSQLHAGNKTYAIKTVRAATSMSLKEAMDYVDNFVDDPAYGAGII